MTSHDVPKSEGSATPTQEVWTLFPDRYEMIVQRRNSRPRPVVRPTRSVAVSWCPAARTISRRPESDISMWIAIPPNSSTYGTERALSTVSAWSGGGDGRPLTMLSATCSCLSPAPVTGYRKWLCLLMLCDKLRGPAARKEPAGCGARPLPCRTAIGERWPWTRETNLSSTPCIIAVVPDGGPRPPAGRDPRKPPSR
jgi:hypothetical protein